MSSNSLVLSSAISDLPSVQFNIFLNSIRHCDFYRLRFCFFFHISHFSTYHFEYMRKVITVLMSLSGNYNFWANWFTDFYSSLWIKICFEQTDVNVVLGVNKVVILNQEWFCLWEDIWQCIEALSQLEQCYWHLNSLKHINQPPTTKN